MIFQVSEFDNDYHAFAGYVYVKADSLAQAEEWCQNRNWTGYSYFVNCELPYELPRTEIDFDVTINDHNIPC